MRRAWPFHWLTCEITGGRCRSCNTSLSPAECSNIRQLFDDHKRHFASVTVFGLVTSPHEYRGMELVLTLELFLPRSRHLPGGVLGVSCLIFKLWCSHCAVQSFPGSEETVLRFRKEHRQHIQNVRLYAVMQTSAGRPVRQQLQVRGEHELSNSTKISEFLSQPVAEELQKLCITFSCTLVGLKCLLCKARFQFHDSDIAEVVAEHEGHLSYVYLHARIDEPHEYCGLDLRFLAHPFEWRSFAHDFKIDCFLFEQRHGKGERASITPWWPADTRRSLQRYAEPGKSVRLRGFVRGKNRELFELELALSPRVVVATEWPDMEKRWLNAQ
jgi:hypothetical protein